ncbi:sulfurtransferase [Deefgea piscis]|uniref:Sulfurtransferase n=1 Tax=Deefgea piscis TaxID=2739061 RepID=A0A6M8SPE9_9NEIS|nr:sulfurtransferase [Deefgea piscis]QKJ65410.1 sulfurtransferase [Deefgea piscis]
MHAVISVSQLQQQFNDPKRVIIDCRHDLSDPQAGRNAYLTSHIKGAQFLHLDEDLAGVLTGKNGRHPLPDPALLAKKLGALGIDAQSHVVAYDASGGPFAARLWFLLRWLGFERCQVLDGGWAAWLQAEGALASGPATVSVQTEFLVQLQPDYMVTADAVLANLSTPQFTVIDARSAERFAGRGETLDPVGGHIPGAKNRFFMLNLDQGYFKSSEQLHQEWRDLMGEIPSTEWVQQCGSGVTACHNLLAMEVAGFKGGRLYAGSWSEWCSDTSRPMVLSSELA